MFSVPNGSNTSSPADGSRTITVNNVQPPPDSSDGESARPTLPQGTLRLRGGPRSRPRVAWDERVIDNENCGRKKSKICCIYHKPKPFDESSDESSEDESDSGDDGRARPPHRHHGHDHQHPPDSSAAHTGGESGLRTGSEGGVVHEVEDESEPNAYEVNPRRGKGRVHGEHPGV